MAEKKGQHLVPACYLGSFIADIEELKKENPKIEAGIYVNSKKLDSGWRMKGVNHDIFKKSYYYNLPEDDPKNPVIENYLSSVESKYIKNLKKVEAREINNSLMSFLSYFMTLQMIRVDKFITQTQKVWDQIAKSCDEFYDENHYEGLFKNIVKKQIPICDLGEIPYRNARIIYNNTTFPFISSDNPVIKREVNNAELSMVIPNSLITKDVKNSKESPFIFFPLTPWIAYISCDLIQADKVIEFDNNNLKNIFYLNYWSILNADIHVYSSIKEPLKGEVQLSQHLMKNFDTNRSIIKIYTANDRLQLQGDLVSSTENTLSITCETGSELSKLVLDERISLIEVFKSNQSIGGMRDCRIKVLDLNAKLITFETDFQL